MASSPTIDPPFPPVKLDPLAAFLSYLIPGLGQIYQGRVGKGLLFFGGLYLLFFYGMWMGQWRNVWLPDADDPKLPPVAVNGQQLEGVPKAITYRFQFLGQFFIGAAAWPAVYQYAVFDRTKDAGPIFGKFQRMPDENELNRLQRDGNKRWDLGWVYTVIAGVLNLLVIYDALAGPMFREPLHTHIDNDIEGAAPATGGAPPTAEPRPAPPVPPPTVPAPPSAPERLPLCPDSLRSALTQSEGA
jgi:TM2 domain-containing membrane protein YozV